MGIYTEAVQKLYVAYFSRPADFGGLDYWEKVVTAANGNTAAVSAAFAASQEYKDTYAGKSAFQIINTIYNNLFGRDAEPAALLFWGEALNNKAVTIDNAVTTIATAAQGTDATAYKNKVAAATAFSAALDTTPEILGYSGTKANDAAKVWLSTVTTDASLATATAPAALATTVNTVAQTGLAETGTTQNLTVGIDTLTGTAGNDTFVGVINVPGGGAADLTTLTSLDTINGGTGADTLLINALTDITSAPTVTLNSIEAVTIRAAKAVNADISSWTGVEQFNITEANGVVDVAAGATTNINANLKSSGTIAVDGGKDVVVKVADVKVAGNTINVGQDVAAKGVVSVESTGTAAVAGPNVTLSNINVKGGTTINVTQNATSSTAGLTVGAVTHIQGNIGIVGNASTTTVNVKQTAAADAVTGVATVAAVRETASVKFNALTAGQSYTVGGLTFTASKAMTAAEVATAFSNLINGTLPVAGDTQGSGVAAKGVYTNAITGWTSGAATGDTVVFTSTAAGNVGNLSVGAGFVGPAAAAPTTLVPVVTDGVAAAGKAAVAGVVAGQVTINDAASSIKTVTVDSYGAGSAITGAATVLETLNLSNSSQGITVSDTAATLALNLNAIGADASAAVNFIAAPTTLNLKSTGANAITLTAAATEALNVSGTGTATVGAGSNLGALKTIVVTETAGLNTGSNTLGNVTSVTTTGTTGTVTVAIDGGKATYAGGAGVDSLTISAATTAVSKSINLGAGNDRLNLSNLDATKLAATDAAVVMEGGEGTDVIVLNAAAAATVSATAGFEARFNGFERLEVGQLMSSQTINLDNLDDINYVIAKGNVAAGGATITKTEGVAGVAVATEAATVTFQALAAGQNYTIGGLTASSVAGATAAEVAAAVAAGVTTGPVTITGAVAGYTAAAGGTADKVVFTSTATNTNVTPDLTVGGTGPAATVSIAQGNAGTTAVTESNVVVFSAMVAGQTVTVGGLTVTASGAATAAEVAAAFVSGASAGNLAVSGALAGWTVTDNGATATNDAKFISTAAGNVADLTATGTGAAGGTTLTLDKMLNNATVQLDAAGSVIVKLADVTGTADVVNLIANAATGANIGTATVAGVETINVTANDTVTGTGISSNTLTLAADAAATVNVSGAGHLNLVLDATTKAVTAINGSAATGNLTIASSAVADAVAVTITGGAGADILTATGNKADILVGGAGDDTLVAGSGLATLTGGAGNDLFKIGVASANVNSYATVTDFAAGDLVQFVGATAFTSAKVSLGETAVFQDYANAAVNALEVGQIGWFTFGGNTYVVADMGADSTTGFVNGQDFIVKLTGTVDLTNASFNATHGTIGLV